MGKGDAPGGALAEPPRRLVDYYRFLAVPRTAPLTMIVEAYLLKVEEGDARTLERAEHALAVLSDPATRTAYDHDLAASQAEVTGTRGTESSRPAGVRLGPSRPADAVVVRPVRPRTAERRAAPHPPSRDRTARAAPPPSPTVIDINGRWALALIPLVALVVGVLVLNHGSATGGAGGGTGTFNQAIIGRLTAQAITAPLGADGVQTLDVAVNGTTMSYRPDVIKVKVGVPVRFNLSVEGRDPG